ncbi:MAG: biotin/lipoyl-containing protein [Pseudomonadota bacterium]|nr:biotin/lipoyl-containing protein [Pseudomonadota bacterium]
MKYEITIGGTMRHVDIEPAGDGRYRVSWEGESHDVDLLRPTPEAYQMLIDGESWEAGCVAVPDGYLVDVMGLSTEVGVVDPRRKALRLAAGTATGMLATQMPGRVVRLLVQVGDPVKKGQPIIVVEAMKMENEMKSPIDGTVGEILVGEGQAVEAGTKLVRVEA